MSDEQRAMGSGGRGAIEKLIEYYMKKPHPFGACVRDNTKRFGKDGAERVCARLKDMGTGTTKWRKGGGEKRSADDGADWAQLLYDAADGNLEGLIEMFQDFQRLDAQEERSALRDDDMLQRFECGRRELRSMPMNDLEMQGNTLVGYAGVYDCVADLGEFTEEVARGAYRKVLAQEKRTLFLYDHMPPPMATLAARTLRLSEDTTGLHVEADLPRHHPHVPMMREQIERGEMRGMSFGFVAGPGNSRLENRGGRPHRILTNFKALTDVSPTCDPAYETTSVELRAAGLAQWAGSDLRQQVLMGAYQQRQGGAEEHDGTGEPDPQATTDVVEEQRSGADDDLEAVAAARRRRLHIMGLALPRGL